MTRHVAVLKGGWSSEREVSLVSGSQCAKALVELGYKVSEIDVGRDIASVLIERKPDVCFNALHGRFGEDGCIQGLLELLQIPYTHSGVAASAVAMDKALAKSVFAANAIRCPPGQILPPVAINARDPYARPYVVKPNREGSSVGVRIVRSGDNTPPIAGDWQFGDDILAEPFIPGRELTVGVMGDRALAVTEIRPNSDFFTYEAKYTEGGAVHIVPAELPVPVTEAALEMALRAHRALGCRGVSRADLRFDDAAGVDGLYLLEINTQPGMTPISLVPEQARYRGTSFAELVGWLVEDALCRA